MRLKILLKDNKNDGALVEKGEDLTSFVSNQIKELSKRKLTLPIKLYHL